MLEALVMYCPSSGGVRSEGKLSEYSACGLTAVLTLSEWSIFHLSFQILSLLTILLTTHV